MNNLVLGENLRSRWNWIILTENRKRKAWRERHVKMHAIRSISSWIDIERLIRNIRLASAKSDYERKSRRSRALNDGILVERIIRRGFEHDRQ